MTAIMAQGTFSHQLSSVLVYAGDVRFTKLNTIFLL